MQNGQTIRICKKCGISQEIERFPVYDVKKCLRRHECNDCNKIRVALNHSQHKEHRLKSARERYAKNPTVRWTKERRNRANELARDRCKKLRDEVYKKFGNECICCGESQPMFLTLDHIKNDGQYMRKKVHGTSSVRIYLQILKGQLEGVFQLLCMNCNFGKARNKGICPHKEGSTTISKESTAK